MAVFTRCDICMHEIVPDEESSFTKVEHTNFKHATGYGLKIDACSKCTKILRGTIADLIGEVYQERFGHGTWKE